MLSICFPWQGAVGLLKAVIYFAFKQINTTDFPEEMVYDDFLLFPSPPPNQSLPKFFILLNIVKITLGVEYFTRKLLFTGFTKYLHYFFCLMRS